MRIVSLRSVLSKGVDAMEAQGCERGHRRASAGNCEERRRGDARRLSGLQGRQGSQEGRHGLGSDHPVLNIIVINTNSIDVCKVCT